MQDNIYKYLPNQRTKFDINYPVRDKTPQSDGIFNFITKHTFNYPEGGKEAVFPQNMNVSNKRYL